MGNTRVSTSRFIKHPSLLIHSLPRMDLCTGTRGHGEQGSACHQTFHTEVLHEKGRHCKNFAELASFDLFTSFYFPLLEPP